MKKISHTALFGTALVLNTFLMRPAALGQEYVSVAMVVGAMLVSGYLITRGSARRVIHKVNRLDIMFVVSIVAMYWIYELPLGFSQGSDDILLAKDFISSIVVTLCYAMFLIEERANEVFFRVFTTVVAILGWSSIVTFCLSQIVGLESLFLFPLNVKGYEVTPSAVAGASQVTTGGVYFPFSMMYSTYTSGDLQLNRYSNFFREAGIYQAVAIFCFAYERFTRRSRFISIGLIGGAIASLSTLGLVLLPLTAGLVYVSRRRVSITRILLFGFFSVIAVIALIFAPAVGLADKMDTHGTSVTDRSDAIHRGVSAIVTDPLGAGLFDRAAKLGDGICLLAAITSLGVIGFILQIVILSGVRPGTKLINPKVVVCFPLFVTAVFSQPIAGSGMTYVLTMVAVPTIVRRGRVTSTSSRASSTISMSPASIR